MFLEVDRLTKSYGSLPVLKALSFSVAEGESVAIMGASGAGKTTLLQILGLLDRADSGSVVINGTSLTSLSARERDLFRNKRIGFVFQAHELLPEFTAVENAALPAMIGGLSRKAALDKASALLCTLNLAERLHINRQLYPVASVNALLWHARSSMIPIYCLPMNRVVAWIVGTKLNCTICCVVYVRNGTKQCSLLHMMLSWQPPVCVRC